MLNFLKRLLNMLVAGANSAVDKIEDPVVLIEQNLRDLRKDLESSMKSLAEAKAVLILLKKNQEDKEKIAVEYEEKALLLLKKAIKGEVDQDEADKLASESLVKKNLALSESVRINSDFSYQDKMVLKLEDKIKKLKSQINSWQSELVVLKTRAKMASSTRKISQQLAQLDSDSTASMLENMKTKIDEQEALAQAYDEINKLDNSVDDEINKALSSSSNLSIADSLAELKAKLLEEGN